MTKDQIKNIIKKSVTEGISEIISAVVMREIYKDCNPKEFEISKEELAGYEISFNTDSNILSVMKRKRVICKIEFYSKIIYNNL